MPISIKERLTLGQWNGVWILGVLFVLFATRLPLIWEDPILAQDDPSVLDRLNRISAPSETFSALTQHRTVEFQPVRDASLKLDLMIKTVSRLPGFHGMNLLIWGVIVFVVFLLFIDTGLGREKAMVLATLFAFHPSLLTSVHWISARNHLLAAVFILTATLWFERQLKNEKRHLIAWVALCYWLAIFSHPLTLLWPVWAAYRLFSEERQNAKRKIILCLAMCAPGLVIAGWLNYRYYSGPLVASQVAKIIDTQAQYREVPFLALGRYFHQFIWPFSLSVDYYPWSVRNLVGFGLWLALFGLGMRRLPFRQFFSRILFILIPLSLATLKMTDVFASDTYLLIPAVGFFLVIADILPRFPILDAHPKRTALVTWSLGLFFLVQSVSWAQAWTSDETLWQYSFDTEVTPRTLEMHIFYELEHKQIEAAFSDSIQLLRWDASRGRLPYLLARSTYLHPHLSPQEKLKVLKASELSSPWIDYYTAVLSAQALNYTTACRSGMTAIEHPEELRNNIEGVAAEVTVFCEKAGESHLERITETAQRRLASHDWDESKFQMQKSKLSSQH